MKNVIKLLLLLVCLTLLASAVACNLQTNPSEPHYHKYVDGKCECGKADINYKPHEHNYVDGKCSCGAIDPNYEPPHEHVYVDGECECGATDPTYEPPHEHVYVDGRCECGATDPDHETPHEHVWSDWEKNNDNGHIKHCECGASRTESHRWNDGVITTPATHTENGVKTYSCTVCGETKTSLLDKTPDHTYTDGKCSCGATDPNYNPPHVHSYVNGKCECGATDPSYTTMLNALIAKVNSQRTALKTHKGKISKYNSNDPEILLFQQYTANIGNPSWGVPPTTPTADHPRLLINRSMLPEIRKSLEAGDKQAKAFQTLLASTITNDCILGAAYDHGTNPTVSTNNVHNLEYEYLEIIQAKALGYLAYDNDYYGYQAILYMKNFLKSLDIAKMASDQCRDYGYVMLTAALVYDWCYDLLTAEDKVQFIAGVENCLCRGTNQAGKKTEYGFPPSGGSSVSGHASEYIVLRDYLSFAVAIYGDNNSWWNYIGGRVYNDYVPMRNYFYQSGMTPQGTGTYITARFVGDIFSAWILKTATGTNPYVNMEQVLRSCLAYEVTPGRLLGDGDGGLDTVDGFRYMDIAYISAYLYGDETVLAHADVLLKGKTLSCGVHKRGYMGINNPIYMALTGMCDISPAKDRYADLDLITYNGAPLGDYLVHSSWNSSDAIIIFTRIRERTTGNHDHADAGTFEIYYKGMLTSDGGSYNNYSAAHTKYFHQATISHNGLIIYNPGKASEDGGWYSGGQRNVRTSPTDLNAWLTSSQMKTGTVTGHQSAYTDESKTKPLYTYSAGDITAAYSSDTVSYVGRRMLTVFTGDPEFPMAFFVFDDITAKQASYEKRFLLQISSMNAPTVNNTDKTVVTENGSGRLVLTCLTDEVKLNALGGRNSGAYNASKSQNYLINGRQCVPQSVTTDDKHWGRVEVVYTGSSAASTFMNVLYVTDKGNANYAEIKEITNSQGLEGGVFDGKIAGLFATARGGASGTLSCTTAGSGNLDYYVSGVMAGEWQVKVNGNDCGTYTATAEGGLLTFTAPAGNVTLTRNNADEIMLENFSTTVLDHPKEVVTVNSIRYSTANTYADFYTVKDATDDYLRIDTTKGAQLQAMANLYDALGGETGVSYRITLAKVEGEKPLAISFRLRDGQDGNNFRDIFTVDADGNVLHGGEKKVGQLTTELTEFKFFVNFKTSRIVYYTADGTPSSVYFEPLSGAETTLDWLSYMTKRYFDFQSVGGSGSIKIGEIGVYRGNIFD